MIIHPPEFKCSNGRYRYSAMVEIETPGVEFSQTKTSKQEIWYDWPEDYFQPDLDHSDSFMVVALPIAMRLGETLKVKGLVSEPLLLNALEVIAIYNFYFPGITKIIDIEATSTKREKKATNRIGSFYSGGIDSLYNIAENHRLKEIYGVKPITDLWLVKGQDWSIDENVIWEKRKQKLFEISSMDDSIRCVDIITNARNRLLNLEQAAYQSSINNSYDLGYSPVLASVGKCFAANVSTAHIGSFLSYDNVQPYTSTPLVDSMWTCDQQTFRHFTARTRRIDKVKTIIEYKPELLQLLRVCMIRSKEKYANCGKCEKCMRTQAEIICAGRPEFLEIFEQKLTPEMLRNFKLPWKRKKETTWPFWDDIHEALEQAGESDYAKALGHALIKGRRKKRYKRAKHYLLGKPY